MVTNTEVKETSTYNLRKVSKPLMEKKRRARINVSLEQLKTLLEKNYSQNIRKRKLEKADILELTVKYLKALQSSMQGVPLCKSPDYHAGFRNCLNSVSQFLMKSEESGQTADLVVSQDLKVRVLPPVSAGFSTKDSNSTSVPLVASNSPYRQKSQGATPLNPDTFTPVTQITVYSCEPFVCQSVPKPNHGLPINKSHALLHCSNSHSLWRPW